MIPGVMISGGFKNCARACIDACTGASRAAILAVTIAVAGVAVGSGTASADTVEAKKIFTGRCMACHTFGKGVKVGPDLKGVTERRQRPWLLKFIRSSQSVIDSGDPIATELFQQFKQQRMPDWIDLSEQQIGSILDWLAINGPEQQEPDARPAELATAAEIDTGRQLFHGERKMVHGGSACASCHAIRDSGGQGGGTLAADLTNVYSQYQDSLMTLFLKHPCVERIPESTLAAFLAPEESFALKAYLRHAALTDQSGSPGHPSATVAKTVDKPSSGGATPTGGPGTAAPRRVLWAPRAIELGPYITRGQRIEAEVLFLAFPYAALLILLVGIAVRYAMALRRRPESLRSASAAAWELFTGRLIWRLGIAVTALLHIVGLVLPGAILAWNGAPLRLYLLEGSGLLFGVLALVGWVQIMRRHIAGTAAGGATLTEIADCVLLSLFCMAIVSGLATAILYRWGSSWSASTLAPYMQSLARGAPATRLIEHMPFLVRLHVLSWFAVIALVPFTSAAMILVSALDRVVMLITRPINAAARAGRRALARLSPARWLWPEEDAVELSGDRDNAQEPS